MEVTLNMSNTKTRRALGMLGGKAAFDAEGARIRIEAANRSKAAAERADKARCARLEREYPYCSVYKADVYASEDGRNICGLSDEEPAAEYRLVQFPSGEWDALAELTWKALRSGCLCILGLESAPQILESALDQERDLGNVAEGVRDAIRGKLRYARKVLTDPEVRAWLPDGGFAHADFTYMEPDEVWDAYAKALRSLTCQECTRDDVEDILGGDAFLSGVLADPDAFEERDVGDDPLYQSVQLLRSKVRK